MLAIPCCPTAPTPPSCAEFGTEEKRKTSRGQRRMKRSESKDRMWIEKEHHEGGKSTFGEKLHPGGAEIASSRAQV